MDHPSVRKGSWTAEEDNLLRICIETNGEGKWHQVPQKAGLNRCRKSCRLRWLNYLKPSIKRGVFADDEVDLIMKLHKLLGNRWSLISGRLPGRTANDVKNFWNSHLRKKAAYDDCHSISKKITTKVNVIKPRPWSFTRRSCLPRALSSNNPFPSPPPLMLAENYEMSSSWWENLPSLHEKEEGTTTTIGEDKEAPSSVELESSGIIEDGLFTNWDDLFLDVDLWDP